MTLLARLAAARHPHTGLVSFLARQGTKKEQVLEHLKQEETQAANIKSKAVRKSVQTALKRMSDLVRRTAMGRNGTAFYAGESV